MSGLNLGIIKETLIRRPPLRLQNRFSALHERVDQLKTYYQRSLVDLENLYGALSQKAFKGELDLSRVPLPGADGAEALSADDPARPAEPAAVAAPLVLPELPDGYSLIGKKRKQALQYWMDHALSTRKTGEVFDLAALVDAVNFRLEVMDDDHAFDREDNDVLRAWLFQTLVDGRLDQQPDIVGMDAEGKPMTGNRVQLVKARATA